MKFAWVYFYVCWILYTVIAIGNLVTADGSTAASSLCFLCFCTWLLKEKIEEGKKDGD